MLKAVRGMGTDEAAVYASRKKLQTKHLLTEWYKIIPTLIAEVLDDFSGKDLKTAIAEFGKKGIKITVKQQAGFGALGGKKGIYEYDGKTYTTGDAKGRNARGQMGKLAVMLVDRYCSRRRYSQHRTQTTSKDNNMTNKTNVTEASMNIQ